MHATLIRRGWRTATLAIVVLTTALTIAVAAPISAQADVGCMTCVAQRPLAPAMHVGWVMLNLNYCAPGNLCTTEYRTTKPAWRWTGYAWRATSIRGGWVYVSPYTGAWRWAWTQESGWVAVYGGRFELAGTVVAN